MDFPWRIDSINLRPACTIECLREQLNAARIKFILNNKTRYASGSNGNPFCVNALKG